MFKNLMQMLGAFFIYKILAPIIDILSGVIGIVFLVFLCLGIAWLIQKCSQLPVT